MIVTWLLPVFALAYSASLGDKGGAVDHRVCIPRPCQAPRCEKTRMTYDLVNGHRCPGCPVCVSSCIPRPCARPPCEKTKMTYYYVNGERCPGCPVCVSPIGPHDFLHSV
ncbi:hypothetical protein ScPMuIL_016089 [Solemya velum]